MSYKQHTMWPGLPAGCYSDDTQFTLALAEAMLRDDKYETWLIKAYQRDPRGCSPKMKQYLTEGMATGKLEIPSKGATAGAAMRASIFGLWPDEKAALEFCTWQAEITHAGDGVLAAKAATLMARYMRGGCRRNGLRRKLYRALGDERFNPASYKGEKPRKPGNNGMECVLAALWLLENSITFSQILKGAINLGGDADTVAVIAMGAAWASREYWHDLPLSMWTGLENGRYGRDYLRRVEIQLLARTCPNLTLRCG